MSLLFMQAVPQKACQIAMLALSAKLSVYLFNCEYTSLFRLNKTNTGAFCML